MSGVWLRDISGRGWWAILKRVLNRFDQHRLPLVAAGVAFYGMLAIFPALTGLISVYGLVADPADVHHLLNAGVLPPGVAKLLHTQTHALAGPGKGALGLSVVIGFLVALWSARRGANALITALNIAYARPEVRGLAWRIGLSLVFTLAAIVFAVIALISVIVIPALLHQFDLGTLWSAGISAIRWPILLCLVGGGLALLYRYVPNRNRPAWRWVVCGAAVGTALWLAGSALFSLYVSHFASYNKIYGTVGTVVVLLMWLFLSALFVLIGAEFNAAIERQARIEVRARESQ